MHLLEFAWNSSVKSITRSRFYIFFCKACFICPWVRNCDHCKISLISGAVGYFSCWNLPRIYLWKAKQEVGIYIFLSAALYTINGTVYYAFWWNMKRSFCNYLYVSYGNESLCGIYIKRNFFVIIWEDLQWNNTMNVLFYFCFYVALHHVKCTDLIRILWNIKIIDYLQRLCRLIEPF